MAVWVFLIIVAVVGAAAVLLYQRTSSGPDVSSPDARSPGRLAQRVGPFRVGTVGLLLGAGFMITYGLVPSGVAMFTVAMFHSVSDGLTVSSTGVAVGMVVPGDRQAGAQGLLGGAQTLMAGLTALLAGVMYDNFGRATAYAVAGGTMLALVAGGLALTGSAWRLRGGHGAVEPQAVVAVD